MTPTRVRNRGVRTPRDMSTYWWSAAASRGWGCYFPGYQKLARALVYAGHEIRPGAIVTADGTLGERPGRLPQH